MSKRRKMMTILGTAIFILELSSTSMALTRTEIDKVSLNISSDIEMGSHESDVEVTTNSTKYEVTAVWTTDRQSYEWEKDEKPKLVVTLCPLKTDDNEYYFADDFSKSKVSLQGDNGKVTSVRQDYGNDITVNIELAALEGDVGLGCDETSGTVWWNESGNAQGYQVRLYRGSIPVTPILSTRNTNYDFSSYITKKGTYSYKVRNIYNKNNMGNWFASDDFEVTSDDLDEIDYQGNTPVNPTGPSVTSETGNWVKDDGGWKYCYDDKNYIFNDWQYIKNKWYYFNESGYRVTGWVKWNENWYYCGENGAMCENTTTPDGYKVGNTGAWIKE